MYRYAIVGAGAQGTAAAYDIGIHGNAEKILLIDACEKTALASAERVNTLLGKNIVEGVAMNARSENALINLLASAGIHTLISAAHYDLNEMMTSVAVQTELNMCDLGGNTGVVRKQHRYHNAADARRITIVPDCGMGPGLNISLGMYAMSLVEHPKEVFIWDGGLPQEPEEPWNYSMTFNIRGLTNEYSGNAFYLRDGKVAEVPALSELETLDFPGTLGALEAAVTSGGLSTAPWTLKGKLERLENKTLRYPGHWGKIQALEALGLFREDLVHVGTAAIVPRDMLHALWGPQITKPEVHDVCVMRVQCNGTNRSGKPARVTVELIDHYDPHTGFTAMQRLTGWHASIVAILCTGQHLPSGVIPVEKISGSLIVKEMEKRGFKISQILN